MKGMLFVTGDKHLDAILKELPFRIQGRALRNALTAAATPIRDEVRATFPKDTGWTAKRFRIKTTKPSRDGRRSARIGVFLAATSKHKFATARAIEFGTVDQPAEFPLRRSMAAKQSVALSRLRSILAAEIPKIAAQFRATGK